MLGILDYGMGNIFSIYNATKHAGFNSKIITSAKQISSCDAIIVPGVGAFKDAMLRIFKLELIDELNIFYESGKYIMGVCLGMQLFGESSNEFGFHKGLGFVPCNTFKIPSHYAGVKLIRPHIMWNRIILNRDSSDVSKLYSHIKENEYMYFVHSFYVDLMPKNNVLTYTRYGEFQFCSSYQFNNVIGIQFHPEKSGENGLRILNNFKKIIYK